MPKDSHAAKKAWETRRARGTDTGFTCSAGCTCGRHDKPKKEKSPCSVKGCDSPSRTRGMCHLHYTAWRKHGDPTLGVRKNMSGLVSYRRAHAKIEEQNGKACDHPCKHCGGVAREWAFLGKNGSFSTKTEDYIPLCKSCHLKMDYAKEAIL